MSIEEINSVTGCDTLAMAQFEQDIFLITDVIEAYTVQTTKIYSVDPRSLASHEMSLSLGSGGTFDVQVSICGPYLLFFEQSNWAMGAATRVFLLNPISGEKVLRCKIGRSFDTCFIRNGKLYLYNEDCILHRKKRVGELQLPDHCKGLNSFPVSQGSK